MAETPDPASSETPSGPPAGAPPPSRPPGPPAGAPPPAKPPPASGPPPAKAPPAGGPPPAAKPPAGAPPAGGPPAAAQPAAQPARGPALATAGAAAAVAAKPAAAPAAPKKVEAPPPAPPKGVSRREFLNYIWGASIVLVLAELAGVTFFFAMPRFRANEQGGVFTKTPEDFPPVGEPPNPDHVGKFWMIANADGSLALYKVCPHLGCIYGYDNTGHRFACPCHGSQFTREGVYIAGPAPRGLDRFAVKVYDASGTVVANGSDGQPFPIPPSAAKIEIDTGKKVPGKSAKA